MQTIVTSGFQMPQTSNAVVPGAPIIGVAIGGDAQANVSWSAPLSNGGAPILWYLVSDNLGRFTIQSAASPITVVGLTNGQPISFYVRAVNLVGASAPSALSNTVTPASVGTMSAVGNFAIDRQGGASNGQFPVTAPEMKIRLVWTAATGTFNRYAILRGINKGAKTLYDTVPAGTLVYEDIAATDFYNAGNIQENSGQAALGFTTWYDYDVVAMDAGNNLGPLPTQFSCIMYKNGVGFCSNSDLSFGMQQAPNYSAADPLGGISIQCVKGAGGCGLQSATFAPLCFNFGLEVNMFNYFYIGVIPALTGQVFDFQFLSRSPNGDVFPHVNLANFANSGLYGPPPVAGQKSLYRIPLALLGYGETLCQGTINNGVFNVSGINSGVGVIDPTCWIATPGNITVPGATQGVWIWTSPNQNGIGNYSVGMGPAAVDGQQPPLPPNILSSTTFSVHRSQAYKTNFKDFTSPAGTTFYVTEEYFGRV